MIKLNLKEVSYLKPVANDSYQGSNVEIKLLDPNELSMKEALEYTGVKKLLLSKVEELNEYSELMSQQDKVKASEYATFEYLTNEKLFLTSRLFEIRSLNTVKFSELTADTFEIFLAYLNKSEE